MKIKIDDIPEAGLELSLKEEGTALGEAAGGTLDFSFPSPVEAHLEFSRTGPNVQVSGEIKAQIRLNCGRCLNEFDHDISLYFSDYFTAGRAVEKDKELKPEDMDISYLEGTEIDTTAMILGQIALDVPIQPLCKEDCKGLCTKCGADLNITECACDKGDKIDPRLAKLKDLKK
ncbi:MAG: hypothetical protein A2X99_05785 [Deltaproteobacteria bacterium GWB2_55_19]|nr:MAG: hypothetical protein A2X99_05785 [Deltaproteobacteria bacterium GWB2_55_19]